MEDNGGPAYPTRGGMMFYIPEEHHGSVRDAIEELDRDHDGMTLRDYFAGQAMMGGLSSEDGANGCVYMDMEEKTREEYIALEAYKVADAMLKEREK